MSRRARTIAPNCNGDPRRGGHRQPIGHAGWCGIDGLYDTAAAPAIHPLIGIVDIVALLPVPQLGWQPQVSVALPTSFKTIDPQFIRFAAIGVVALFVDMAALWAALQLIGLNLYTGRLFSFLVAATFTWACNRSLNFAGSGTGGAIRQWARFIFFNAIGGIVNFAVYVLVAVKLREALPWPGQIASVLPYLGVACGSLCGLAFNFLTSKFFVFR